MASSGKGTKASALQRGGSAGRRDPDETDPAAALTDADPGDIEEEPTVGAGDKTQLYDGQAAAAPPATTFKLVVLAGPKAGADYPLDQAQVTVGRAADNPVSIPDVSVSRRHVKLTRQGDEGFVVEDLGSGNGTKVNDVRADGSALVRHGDEISIGDTVLQLVEVGVPVVKKRARGPRPPSGATASPTAPTQAEQGKVPPPRPAPAGGLDPKRKRLYLVAGTVFGLLLLLVVVAKLKPRAPAPAPVNSGASEARQAMDEATQLERDNRWIEAEATLARVAGQTADATVQQTYEKVKREATYQRQLEKAKAALQAQDLAGAKALAGAIPVEAAVYDQAQRLLQSVTGAIAQAVLDGKAALAAGDRAKAADLVQKVLAADPDNDDARDLQADLEKKPRPKHVKKKATKVSRTAAAKKPPGFRMSEALSMYLAGDVGRALQLAEQTNDPIARNLRRFDMAARDGLSKVQANRSAEAVKSLALAVKIDRALAHGKKSKPGGEVARALGNQEYLLGVDCKGDSQLARAAAHFRAAEAADPSTALYGRALDKVYVKAHDLYMQGYVARPTDPDTARQEFKVACDTLPASDEKHGRACSFYQQLSSGN